MGQSRGSRIISRPVCAWCIATLFAGTVLPFTAYAHVSSPPAALSSLVSSSTSPRVVGQLRGVSFPDVSDGWSVGTGGTAAAGYGGLILHTADGGASWLQQLFPSQAAQSQATFPRGVYFLNPTTGWVVGSNNLSNGSPII
jgi:photosystem II stability/assembly factor-like uncharacterized protein